MKKITIIYILSIIIYIWFIITMANYNFDELNVITFFKSMFTDLGLMSTIAFSCFTCIYLYLILPEIKKLNKDDFNKNIEYYREIIYEYSPGVISYIDNFNVDKKTLISTLMSLEKKNKLSFNSKIEIITNATSDLSLNELYIYNLIKNNEFDKFNFQLFKNEIFKDCTNKKLLRNNSKETKLSPKLISFTITLELLGALLHSITLFSNIPILKVINVISSIFLFSGIIVFIIIMYTTLFTEAMNNIEMKSIPYLRTKKGENLNKKIEGLKRYLKEFSTLKDESKDALAIWDDYLIYSVLFGQNTQIIDEYLEKFYIEKEDDI